ncbi:MAG: helical backbone metal receptor [Actinomycetota bacterium]
MGRLSALFLCLTLATTACGSEPGSPSSTAPSPIHDDAFPVTIRAANGALEIAARPKRIVSLSPTATEMLFAVGAGDQVIAVDDQSDYPPGVPTTELSGFEPNVEAIARYEPDLVLAESDHPALKPLGKLKIPLLVQPAAKTLADTYAQIEQTGVATGHIAEAAEQVATMRSEIERILEAIPTFEEAPSYYHELDPTYFSVTSDTFIGHVYKLAGLRNIADKADKAGSGYPQLSAEYIVEANPDLIFLADSECCNQTPGRVAARPGWDQIAAVKNDAVIVVGDDVSSRWGPRVVEFLQVVVDGLRQLETART